MLDEVEAIVFSGGGVRGISYAAMLDELALSGFDFYSRSRNLRTVVGTSIGALFGAMVTAGTEPAEFVTQAKKNDSAKHISVDVAGLFTSWGLDDGTTLENWIEDLLESKLGERHVTMERFYALTHVEFRGGRD